MKNLVKGLSLVCFIALTACQNGFDSKASAPGTLSTTEVAPEIQQAAVATQENVQKMEVNVDQSLQQLDSLFASMQTAILTNQANMSASSGSGFNVGSILGSIGSIILGGFNPISLITGGINIVSNLINGFSGGSQPAVFTNFQATFNDIFSNVQTVVGQAKAVIATQRSLVLSQLSALDPNNPAQAALYKQLMGIMTQLDAADQKIIVKVDNINTLIQSFMSRVGTIQQGNASSGIGAMAGSFLQNFQGVIGTAIQTLLNIL